MYERQETLARLTTLIADFIAVERIPNDCYKTTSHSKNLASVIIDNIVIMKNKIVDSEKIVKIESNHC